MCSTQTEMMRLLNEMSRQMTAERELKYKAEEEVTALKKQLTDLTQKLDSQKNSSVQASEQDIPEAPSAPPKPSLLLGTSLLRNINPDDLVNCEVIAKGGATLTELHVALNDLPEDKGYSEVTIVGGSIDVEQNTAEDIITEFQAMTVSAYLRADKVSICSVLPRMDKNLSEPIAQVNEQLKKVCEDEGINFRDMDDTFRLRNDQPNKACFAKDGLRLSQYGVECLLEDCEVQQTSGTAFTQERYKKKEDPLKFKGHGHPLSNFYPLKNFAVNGISFSTSEAAYVHAMALHHKDHTNAEAVRSSRTGIHAKRLGNRIWTDNK